MYRRTGWSCWARCLMKMCARPVFSGKKPTVRSLRAVFSLGSKLLQVVFYLLGAREVFFFIRFGRVLVCFFWSVLKMVEFYRIFLNFRWKARGITHLDMGMCTLWGLSQRSHLPQHLLDRSLLHRNCSWLNGWRNRHLLRIMRNVMVILPNLWDVGFSVHCLLIQR